MVRNRPRLTVMSTGSATYRIIIVLPAVKVKRSLLFVEVLGGEISPQSLSMMVVSSESRRGTARASSTHFVYLSRSVWVHRVVTFYSFILEIDCSTEPMRIVLVDWEDNNVFREDVDLRESNQPVAGMTDAVGHFAYLFCPSSDFRLGVIVC